MEQKIQEANVLVQHTDHYINNVWERARVIPNFDPAMYRKDIYGAWIKREEYGQNSVNLSLGWSIITLQTAEQDSDKEQHIPVQWQNATAHLKGFKLGVITASGIINTKVLQT